MKTPLLQLKNIGKIYVSESNVSVGIRGVDLSFERGEFVAITGRSGSGKSTLLNVISGMDTYEEGEMLVEGEPTSHFVQKDWEQYRKDYISFIFQDYNIIESFTVLQNVELALMNMEDPKERRMRALELLKRVGLEKHIHHKGSKLSGGQKQRTVIARALAKDSPIILADEPTGNLDSQSSAEIIELLREVSEDKLVIVVTHNFEQVENCATRHIRVFDGAVELDHRVRPAAVVSAPVQEKTKPATPPSHKTVHTLRNGLILGRVRFGATPKLSVFLCILMTVTALVITMTSAKSDDAKGLFDKTEMFTHIKGRTVIVRTDGAVITEKELQALAADIGAVDYMHYDFMLDNYVFEEMGREDGLQTRFTFGYPASDVKPDVGRLPERDNEILLELPISDQTLLGDRETFKERPIQLFDRAEYTVVGVNYYYDNTRDARMLFTESGYKIASALCYYNAQAKSFVYTLAFDQVGRTDTIGMQTLVDFDMAPGTYYINSSNISEMAAKLGVARDELAISLSMKGSFTNYDEYREYSYVVADVYYDTMVETKPGYGEQATVTYSFDRQTAVWSLPAAARSRLETRYFTTWSDTYGIQMEEFVLVAPDVLTDFLYEHYYTQAYTQASLFFENDREAHDMVEVLRELGYTAVVSDEIIEENVFTELLNKLGAGVSAVGWVISIVFASLFLSLCSSRAMNATRGDIAIMRSMGIPAGVVRVSIYVQTLIALIPAFVITAATCTVVYLLPQTNYMFSFLHADTYILIAVVLVGIALNLARLYVRKMFGESVKKTLKGGSAK